MRFRQLVYKWASGGFLLGEFVNRHASDLPGSLVDILHQVRSLQTAKSLLIDQQHLPDDSPCVGHFLEPSSGIGSQSQNRVGRLHWVGSPQMLPLQFGIVVKRHYPIPVLVDQISHCLQSFLATPMLESSFDLLGFLPVTSTVARGELLKVAAILYVKPS